MALEIETMGAPERSRTARYTPAEAVAVLDAIQKLPDGKVVAFDELRPKPHQARTLARAMIVAINATEKGHGIEFVTSVIPVGKDFRAGLRLKK